MKLFLSILIFILLTSSFESQAQKRRYGMNNNKRQTSYRGGKIQHGGIGIKKYSTVGVSINTMNYFGDITPTPSRFSTDVAFPKPGIGITYSKVFHPRAAWRAAINYGSISGDDITADNSTPPSQYLYLRNLHFRNSILEVSWGLEINLIPNSGGANNRFPLNPYIFLGIAGFKHNPQAIAPEFDLTGRPLAEAGEWVDLQPLGTEGQNLAGGKPYSLIQVAIPIGFGMKVRLPDDWDLHFEVGFRQLFTDYIDDVGGAYPNLSELDNELVRALSERSGESTGMLSGENRTYNGSNVVAKPWSFRDPVSGDLTGTYNVGGNYGFDNIESQGSIRGSSGQKDLYIVTQLRLVYIFGHVSRKKAKFI